MLPDLVGAAALIAERGITLGAPLHILDETTSTNDEAKAAAKGRCTPRGHVGDRVADGGARPARARLGLAAGGKPPLSVLLRLRCAPARLPPLALVAGLAARDAVARAAPERDVRIKWPNDVVVGSERKKISGVLVEAILQGSSVEALVVGIGINVHTREFPEDAAPHATSIALESRRPADRAEILADVLTGLDREMELAAARGLGLVHARLSRADALAGEHVQSEGTDRDAGTAEGVDLEGRLLVRRADGVLVRWGAGEVRLVPRP